MATDLNKGIARDTATTDRDASTLSGEALMNDLGTAAVAATKPSSPAVIPNRVGLTVKDDHGNSFGGIATIEFDDASTVTNPSSGQANVGARWPHFMTVAMSAIYDVAGSIVGLTNSTTRVRTHGYTQARLTASADATGAATLTVKYYNVAGSSWDDLGLSAITLTLAPGTDHPVYTGWIELAANAVNTDIDIRVYPSGYTDPTDADPQNIQVQFLSGPILGGSGGGGGAAPVIVPVEG